MTNVYDQCMIFIEKYNKSNVWKARRNNELVNGLVALVSPWVK